MKAIRLTMPDDPVTKDELAELQRLAEYLRTRLFVAVGCSRTSIGTKRGARAAITGSVDKLIGFAEDLKGWI